MDKIAAFPQHTNGIHLYWDDSKELFPFSHSENPLTLFSWIREWLFDKPKWGTVRWDVVLIKNKPKWGRIQWDVVTVDEAAKAAPDACVWFAVTWPILAESDRYHGDSSADLTSYAAHACTVPIPCVSKRNDSGELQYQLSSGRAQRLPNLARLGWAHWEN